MKVFSFPSVLPIVRSFSNLSLIQSLHSSKDLLMVMRPSLPRLLMS